MHDTHPHIAVINPGHLDTSSISDAITVGKSPELGCKGRLFKLLAERGFRIPATVSVQFPSFSFRETDWVANFRQLIEKWVTASLALLEEQTQKRVGDERNPLMLAVRADVSPSTPSCPAGIFNRLLFETSEDERCRTIISQIADWVTHLLSHSGKSERSLANIDLLGFLLQEYCPTTTTGKDALGQLWTCDPMTGDAAPSGYVRMREPSGGWTYCTYSSWAEKERDAALELGAWLQNLSALTQHPYLLNFAFAGGTVYALALHVAELGPTARLRFVSQALRASVLENDQRISLVRPEDLFAVSLLPESERRRLAILASFETGGPLLACGRVAFSQSQIKEFSRQGDPVIWAKNNLELSEVSLLDLVAGLITKEGGPASHALVIARGRNVATVPGLRSLQLANEDTGMALGSELVHPGEWLTIEEATGTLYRGKAEPLLTRISELDDVAVLALQRNCDRIKVNADTGPQVRQGFARGATGVGLCRSENHVLGPDTLLAFRRWVLENTRLQVGPMPDAVSDALQSTLADVLVAANGQWVHYRLFDARLEELLPAPSSGEASELAQCLELCPSVLDDRLREIRAGGTVHGCRGSRWGMRTGFYRQQLRLAVDAVSSVAPDIPVRMAVIAPLVNNAQELLAVRRLLEADLSTLSRRGQQEIRFGCMIETPRSCLVAGHLAKYAEVLCLGTNDLTQAVWALSREVGQDVVAHWYAEGVVESDPFITLDETGVGALIKTAVHSAKVVNPAVDIVACGEHASDPRSAAWLRRNGVDYVSCRPEAIAAVAVALTQAEAGDTHGTEPPCYFARTPSASEASQRAFNRIRHARISGDYELARHLAREWSATVTSGLGLQMVENWKFFKRNLARHWFSPAEQQRFGPGWNTNDALQYALSYRGSGRTVRYSLFPATIACHAVSKILDESLPVESWRAEMEGLDHSASLEVFPQQPPTNLCFRAIFWPSHIDLEAGIGQAMYVFEEQRGQHPVVRAAMDKWGDWQIGKPSMGVDSRLERGIQDFLKRYGTWVSLRLWDMVTTLGTGWLGIEGYWDQATYAEPFVCDLDLPHDLAFLPAD